MTDEMMVEQLAEMDDQSKWEVIEHYSEYDGSVTGSYSITPDYLASHDAVQMVVDGLDYSDLIDYREILYDMPEFVREYDHHKATPRQKVEAVLRAVGRWA